MRATTIAWIIYDGTWKTRPHSIRKDWFDASEKQWNKFCSGYLSREKERNL